jgi:hypothetical protein
VEKVEEGQVLETLIWKSSSEQAFQMQIFLYREVLSPQGKQNCFPEVRNKKRLEVDFNLGA